MFGLLKKSKPLQNDKQRKRQNRSNDEKWVRSGDRPFTKAKRSNRVVLDQNELQTYASLEKMLHKAIHAIRQLKRKGNTNTSSATKHQCKSSYLSNSDLKTNEISFDKSKGVKPTSKAHSTRCFKCHRIDHYANKCQKQKPLVILENENFETKPEKEEPLPIQKPDQTQGEHCVDYAVLRASRLELRLEPRPDDRTTARLPRPTQYSKTHSRARLSLGREETEDGHAFSSGRPSGQSCKRPYRYPVHTSGWDEPEHLD
ncbi:hypothetical protein YC2023_082522 [Brassica napus]